MKNESKTLYLPLYGKAYVSQKQIILHDIDAERIWNQEYFPLKGKAKSKYLAYYMAMRSAFIDEFVLQKIHKDSCVLHLGCGLDSRFQRLSLSQPWYDIDFDDVIQIRKTYYPTKENYHMIGHDITDIKFLNNIPHHQHGIIILEGVSMYLQKDSLLQLFQALEKHFDSLDIILDAYSTFALEAGRKRNPISSVNAIATFGMDDGHILETNTIKLTNTYPIAQKKYIQQCTKWEQFIFHFIYANRFTTKLYQIYTYEKARL